MELDPDEMQAVVKRLKRAQGQIGGVLKMIDEGRECQDIVTQLAAVSKALRTGEVRLGQVRSGHQSRNAGDDSQYSVHHHEHDWQDVHQVRHARNPAGLVRKVAAWLTCSMRHEK